MRHRVYLAQENTRLQSKVVRLNLGSSRLEEPSPSPSYLEDMKDLKEENAELREDNDKLLSYLDGLEERKKELEAIVASRSGKQKLNIVLGSLDSKCQTLMSIMRLCSVLTSAYQTCEF